MQENVSSVLSRRVARTTVSCPGAEGARGPVQGLGSRMVSPGATTAGLTKNVTRPASAPAAGRHSEPPPLVASQPGWQGHPGHLRLMCVYLAMRYFPPLTCIITMESAPRPLWSLGLRL